MIPDPEPNERTWLIPLENSDPILRTELIKEEQAQAIISQYSRDARTLKFEEDEALPTEVRSNADIEKIRGTRPDLLESINDVYRQFYPIKRELNRKKELDLSHVNPKQFPFNEEEFQRRWPKEIPPEPPDPVLRKHQTGAGTGDRWRSVPDTHLLAPAPARLS